jgi:hypothetical protein
MEEQRSQWLTDQRSQWPKDAEAVNGRTEITMTKRYRSCKWKDRDHNGQKIQKL